MDTNYLRVRALAPDWYYKAMADAGETRFVDVQGCAVHYLHWAAKRRAVGNLLLIHGGGGHAYWWSFLAPMLSRDLNVAALCLSGMGDSGARDYYDSDVRVADMRGVIADAFRDGPTFLLGHSFGGFMACRFGQLHGEEIDGIIIADSAIRPRHKREEYVKRLPRMGNKRHYAEFDEALARFRLFPEQPCENEFLVEHIGRHSLKWELEGWCWKWHGGAMNNRRLGEPFHEYLAAAICRKAFIYGEKSAVIDENTLAFITGMLGDNAPVIGIPEAHHHLMLDQPIAFVVAVRGVLAAWGTVKKVE